MINDNKYLNRTIALAGVFQACELTKQLAWQGSCDKIFFNACMYSLLKISAVSVVDVYKNLQNLGLGLKSLHQFLHKKTKKDLEITKYVFSLLYLEQNLKNRKDLTQVIQAGITRAQQQATIFPLEHENIIANFAGIYLNTLSTLNFRINIVGNQLHLSNIQIINKIRALLLAGIRSAILWKQLGGSKLNLLFNRAVFINCTEELIKVALNQQKEPAVIN